MHVYIYSKAIPNLKIKRKHKKLINKITYQNQKSGYYSGLKTNSGLDEDIDVCV